MKEKRKNKATFHEARGLKGEHVARFHEREGENKTMELEFVRPKD